WARDCDEPSSPTNNLRAAYMSQLGDPEFTESLGPDSDPNVYAILSARRDGDDIVLHVKINGRVEQELTMHRDNARIRTMTNRNLDSGKYVVRKGKVLSNGRDTPWLTQCSDKKS